MKALLAVALLGLVGCGNSPIPSWEIDRAVQFCSDKGGLYSVTGADHANYSSVRCNNGDKHSWGILED